MFCDSAAASVQTPSNRPELINEQIEAIRIPEDLITKLVALETPALAVVLSSIMQQAGMTDKELKEGRTFLPSFSKVIWESFAKKRGLPLSPNVINTRPPFKAPPCFLPPSRLQAMFQDGWRLMDMYQERPSQEREAARLRLLEPWLIPIITLFKGRVIDRPESDLPGTPYSTGGRVEHEIVMFGEALFLVIELKLELKDNNVAQLFLELLSAAELNKEYNFGELRVHGLLTNLETFYFYSYNPLTGNFDPDEKLRINNQRDEFCFDMIRVANKIFSIVMSGYIQGLQATYQKSKSKSEAGNMSEVGSGPEQQLLQLPSLLLPVPQPQLSGECQSLFAWEKALNFAQKAYGLLQILTDNVAALEKNSSEGLDCLTYSLQYVPRVSEYTSKSKPKTPEELQTLAESQVQKWYEVAIQQHAQNQETQENLYE